MKLSNLEYVPMRLVRKFLFRDAFLLRFGRLIPHYRVNRNQADPGPLVSDYAAHLTQQGFNPKQTNILEIGVGATNSTGYELAARLSPAGVTLLEPFVPLSELEDQRLLKTLSARHQVEPSGLAAMVQRFTDSASIASESIDLVLSSSVLEHVTAPEPLFLELKRMLKPHGAMLHLVDYRDHFFKYPYHFLQFSEATWQRWLNPGDLPRWRVYDHVEALNHAGFSAELVQIRANAEAFAAISPRVDPRFRRDDPRTAIEFAAIWSKPIR